MQMTRRARVLIPRAVLIADLVLIAITVGSQVLDPAASGGDAFIVLIVAMIVGLGLIGALIVRRQPGNAVGWIFLASSTGMGLAMSSYGWVALSHEQYRLSLPGTVFAAWLDSWIAIPSLTMLVIFVPLLFPTGRLPSPRWRGVALFASIGIVATSVGSALVAGPLDVVGVDNPIGVRLPEPLLSVAGIVDALSGLVVFSLALASVVVRYRHGSPLERLQLRWFAFPAGIGIVCLGVSSFADTGPAGDVAWLGVIVCMALLPLAIGIAILRHRLFDIDLVIKRTATYGALSLLLIGLEVTGVLVLQELLSSITEAQTYAVAATTLFVAAVSQPARRRIRSWVDRRFDRSRYDAEVTVARFSRELRSGVDLAEVSRQLVGTTHAVLRPAEITLWVRSHERPS